MSATPPANHSHLRSVPPASADGPGASTGSSASSQPGARLSSGASVLGVAPALSVKPDGKVQATVGEIPEPESVVRRKVSMGSTAAKHDGVGSIDASCARLLSRTDPGKTVCRETRDKVYKEIRGFQTANQNDKEEQLLSALIAKLPQLPNEQITGAVWGILESCGPISEKKKYALLNQILAGLTVDQHGAAGAAVGLDRLFLLDLDLGPLTPILERLDPPAMTAFACGLAAQLKPDEHKMLFSPYIDAARKNSSNAAVSTGHLERIDAFELGAKHGLQEVLSRIAQADGKARLGASAN